MRISKVDFEQFLVHARKLVPGFKVHDGKEDSYLMNLIDGIVWPFNPKFMTGYITTIISGVYFPKGRIAANPRSALEVCGHELVHAYDAKRLTFPLFGALYLSAVSLSIVAMVLVGSLVSVAAFIPFAALAIHAASTAVTFKIRKVTGFPLLLASLLLSVWLTAHLEGAKAWWMLVILVGLCPLPAPGRAWAEFRGYGMSILLEIKLFGEAEINSKVKRFTGPDYYWMMPFESMVRKILEKYRADGEGGVENNDPVFVHINKFFSLMESRSLTGEKL